MKCSRGVLLLMLIVAACIGVMESLVTLSPGPFNEAGVLQSVINGVLLYCWYRADLRERMIVPRASVTLLVGSLGPFGIPYYFLRTMPFRSAALSMTKALGFLLLLAASQSAGKWLGVWGKAILG